MESFSPEDRGEEGGAFRKELDRQLPFACASGLELAFTTAFCLFVAILHPLPFPF